MGVGKSNKPFSITVLKRKYVKILMVGGNFFLGSFFLGRVVTPYLKICINHSRTYVKQNCKENHISSSVIEIFRNRQTDIDRFTFIEGFLEDRKKMICFFI